MDINAKEKFMLLVKKTMLEKGISTRKLGSEVGIAYSEISRKLNNIHNITLDQAINICNALDIPQSYAYQIFPEIKYNNESLNERFINLSTDKQQQVLDYIEFLINDDITNETKDSVNKLVLSINKNG